MDMDILQEIWALILNFWAQLQDLISKLFS